MITCKAALAAFLVYAITSAFVVGFIYLIAYCEFENDVTIKSNIDGVSRWESRDILYTNLVGFKKLGSLENEK